MSDQAETVPKSVFDQRLKAKNERIELLTQQLAASKQQLTSVQAEFDAHKTRYSELESAHEASRLGQAWASIGIDDETAQAQLRRIYETVDPEGRPSFVDWVTSDEAREDPLVQYILPPKPVEGVEPAPAPKPAPKGFAGDRAVQTPTTLGSKPTQPASPEAWTAHFRGMTNDQLEAYIAQEP